MLLCSYVFILPTSVYLLADHTMTDLRCLKAASRKRRQQAFRPGTTRNHTQQFKLYLSFCLHFHLQDINPTADTICWYIEFLARSFQSPKSIKNYISGIRLLHKLTHVECPNLYSFEVHLHLRALPLTMNRFPKQKLPITLDLLLKLCQLSTPLGDIGKVLKCAFLFAFFGYLRQSNIASPLSKGV